MYLRSNGIWNSMLYRNTSLKSSGSVTEQPSPRMPTMALGSHGTSDNVNPKTKLVRLLLCPVISDDLGDF